MWLEIFGELQKQIFNMKKLFFLLGLFIMVISFSGCLEGAYVSDQPSYIEIEHPPRPSPQHIWIEGDWQWNRQSHNYYHRNGNWIVPQRNRTYSPGFWQHSPRGNHWRSGRWH